MNPTFGYFLVVLSSTTQHPSHACKRQLSSMYSYFLALLQILTFDISHCMTATIGFNAVCFQLSFTMHLLLAFVELVVIEYLAIDLVFPNMLGQSYKLGCHSDMIFMMPDSHSSLTITKFSWTHCELHPWGQYLPLQCPQCGWTNAWCSVCVSKDYHFECKNDACRKEYTFSQPPHSKGLLPGKRPGSCWISISLEPTPQTSDDDLSDGVSDDECDGMVD